MYAMEFNGYYASISRGTQIRRHCQNDRICQYPCGKLRTRVLSIEYDQLLRYPASRYQRRPNGTVISRVEYVFYTDNSSSSSDGSGTRTTLCSGNQRRVTYCRTTPVTYIF